MHISALLQQQWRNVRAEGFRRMRCRGPTGCGRAACGVRATDVAQTVWPCLEGTGRLHKCHEGCLFAFAALLRYWTPQPDIKRYSRVTVRRF